MNPDFVDAQLNQACIPPFILAGVLDHAQENGVQPEALLSGLGLTALQIRRAETLISFRQAATIIRRAIRALPGEPTGLLVGSRGALGSFGVLGLAMIASENVGYALAIGMENHRTAGSLMEFEMERGADEIAIFVHERFPEQDLLPFLSEEALASIVTLLRFAVGPEVSPRLVELSYPEPSYAAHYRKLFNCPVHFNQACTRLVLASTVLQTPLPGYSLASSTTALQASRQLIPTTETTPDIVASVRNLLQRNCRQRPSMTDIAQQLNVTERTLRRNLTAAGQSFSTIRDRVLEQRARDLLNQARLSVTTVAAELGFSDLREFRRAFQRWTGKSPSQLRKEAEAQKQEVGG